MHVAARAEAVLFHLWIVTFLMPTLCCRCSGVALTRDRTL